MKHGLTAITALFSLALCACGPQPASDTSLLETPVPTAADLAAHGTLSDWERASSEDRTAFLENAATPRADEILKAAPSASADDALSAAVIYFRQCLDAFTFAKVDPPTTSLSSMLNQCETAFNAADSQIYLARVYQARQSIDSNPPPGPEPLPEKDIGTNAKNIVEPEHNPPPDFGE